MHRTRGITVFDLLVTLAIAAVLMTIAVPGLRAWSLNQALSAAVTALQADLRLARAEAVRLRVPVVVCPAGQTGTCATLPAWQDGWLVFADSDGDREYTAGEPLLRSAPPVEGLDIDSSQTRVRLRFSPRGTAPGSNASVTFCDERGPEKARQLRLSASGRIRVLGPEEARVSAC